MITREEFLKTLNSFENAVYNDALDDARNGDDNYKDWYIESYRLGKLIMAWFDWAQPLIELGKQAQQEGENDGH